MHGLDRVSFGVSAFCYVLFLYKVFVYCSVHGEVHGFRLDGVSFIVVFRALFSALCIALCRSLFRAL